MALSRLGGLYVSKDFTNWNATISTGCAASGTSIVVTWGSAVLPDGTEFLPFDNSSGQFPPIIVGSGATQETVVPTSVSNAYYGRSGVAFQVCTITVSGGFTNAHYPGEQVVSGDQGIVEALNTASARGGGPVLWMADTGTVTLSTTGLTTTTTTKVPGSFYNQGCAARVTTTITTSASWAVGISGATTIFASANSTLTAGTTAVANQAAPATTGTSQALTAILITAGTSNAGAGAVHVRAWGYTAAQPAF